MSRVVRWANGNTCYSMDLDNVIAIWRADVEKAKAEMARRAEGKPRKMWPREADPVALTLSGLADAEDKAARFEAGDDSWVPITMRSTWPSLYPVGTCRGDAYARRWW